MTSLFFVMLVLYVLTFVKLKYQQQATLEQLNKIKEVQSAVKELDTVYFSYQPEYKRFTLNKQIHFEKGSSLINPGDVTYLHSVGKCIMDLIQKLKKKYNNDNIKYLIVIEGMSSKSHYNVDEYRNNDVLSYQRSLSLLKMWNENGINFDPNICDVQVAGSGEGGIGRDIQNEEANQRFLIQIIPKIGEIK